MLSNGELRGAQEPLMARSQSRLTAEIDFNRNGKQHGFIRLPYSVHRSAYGWIPIPVACVKNGAGPRILLMAGNHGDEYEGQVALGKLIRDLEPDEVSGRIIILPSANFPAAMAGMRTSPLDGGNLNRSFPGDPYGGPTEQRRHARPRRAAPAMLPFRLAYRHCGGGARRRQKQGQTLLHQSIPIRCSQRSRVDHD
jgi:predicted deacylase